MARGLINAKRWKKFLAFEQPVSEKLAGFCILKQRELVKWPVPDSAEAGKTHGPGAGRRAATLKNTQPAAAPAQVVVGLRRGRAAAADPEDWGRNIGIDSETRAVSTFMRAAVRLAFDLRSNGVDADPGA